MTDPGAKRLANALLDVLLVVDDDDELMALALDSAAPGLDDIFEMHMDDAGEVHINAGALFEALIPLLDGLTRAVAASEGIDRTDVVARLRELVDAHEWR